MEQGWTRDFALGAIEQYRRFCFLACISPTPVTPSEEVDAVWHLHLLYTRDYWEVFCPNVLNRDFHHGPTQGGKDEEDRFYTQYARTLILYQYWFGAPPIQYWPPALDRFRPSVRSRWVYMPENWVIRKPKWYRYLVKQLHTMLPQRTSS